MNVVAVCACTCVYMYMHMYIYMFNNFCVPVLDWVPLGVTLKNENISAEMIEIMESLHRYVPSRVSEQATMPTWWRSTNVCKGTECQAPSEGF